MRRFPRITFGIILLNGEPFTRYNLRSLYPFAHQIIAVEGAALGAANVATPDGHSIDHTLDTLRDFKAREDPDDKLTIITAEDEGYPNGFWPGEKHQQSQAYAKRATGDYLWQVDIDEFYKPEDMRTVIEMLSDHPDITAVSFKQITFWGGFDYVTDGWYLRGGAEIYHRIFKWGEGCSYVTHRPPTVHDPSGQDLRHIKWVGGYEMARRGILLYHYSLVFPKNVLEKCGYYSEAVWATHAKKANEWAHTNFLTLGNPFRVHNVYQFPSWLERFHGEHPLEIVRLQQDIHDGRGGVALRQTDDIERILCSRSYALKRALLVWRYPLGNRISQTKNLVLWTVSRVKRTVANFFATSMRRTDS